MYWVLYGGIIIIVVLYLIYINSYILIVTIKINAHKKNVNIFHKLIK